MSEDPQEQQRRDQLNAIVYNAIRANPNFNQDTADFVMRQVEEKDAARRDKRRGRPAHPLMTTIVCLFVLIAIIFILFGVVTRVTAVSASGTVVSASSDSCLGKSHADNCHQYQVSYAIDGQSLTATVRYIHATLQPGDTVTVLVRPGNHTSASFPFMVSRYVPFWAEAAIFAGVGAVVFAFVFRSMNHDDRKSAGAPPDQPPGYTA